MVEWSCGVDDVSKIRMARPDEPQSLAVVHVTYQVVDNKDPGDRAAMGEEDTGSSEVDWKQLAALVAAGSCPGIAGEVGLDTEDAPLEAREVQVQDARASMVVAVPLHTGVVAVEVLGRVLGEGKLVCSAVGSPGDTPNVRALLLPQRVEAVADNGGMHARSEQGTDLFSWEGRAPPMEAMEANLFGRKLKSQEYYLLSFLRFAFQCEVAKKEMPSFLLWQKHLLALHSQGLSRDQETRQPPGKGCSSRQSRVELWLLVLLLLPASSVCSFLD